MTSGPPRSFNKYKKKISITKSDTIGDFKIGSKIGQGTFSKVCLGIHIPTGEKVAIKILPKNQIKEKNDKIRIEKEINLQKKLHHQNIIHQYSVLDTDTFIYIITEYCSGGELFDYIVSKRRLPEMEACRIFQQLINGLEYLHKQKICHRDLKPENLLFDTKKNLKIADFGLSNEYITGKLGTPCGSPCYAAPEMVTGQKYMGDTVDIWSSGIVLYSMVCGFLPFEDEDQTVLFHKIAKGLFSLPGYLSYNCKDLIKHILVTNPSKRYGFDDIKKHPWFTSVNNVSGKNNLFNSPGIIIDYDVIPIDINIIKEMYYAKEYKNFSISNIISDVIRNKHNKITTAYYLILKKILRRNGQSVSDITSNSKLFIEYMKKPISKMSYWDNDYEKIISYYTEKVKEIINKKKDFINYKKNNLPILTTQNNDLTIYDKTEYSVTEEKRININDNQLKENKITIESNTNNKNMETIAYNEDTEKSKKKTNKEINDIKYSVYNPKNISIDTDEEFYGYKLTNYELDSDETLLKEINNHSFNKKQLNELLKTNDNNTIEEKENNNLSSESSEIAIDKIIKEAQNSVTTNRNKNNYKKRIKSVENKDINENKINKDEKDKTEKNKYVYNNISIDNKNIKVYKKEKFSNNKFPLNGISNNSYLYKKLQSLIVKEDKVNKFINKKRINKVSPKEIGAKYKMNNNILNKGNKNNINYKKINLNLNFNSKKLETQEAKNINLNNNYINSTLSGTNSYKDSNSNIKNSEENNRINNNIKVQNINNYIIDVHKYKINLIGNSNYYKNMNLIEFYKKLNNTNKYNKFISNSNKKNNNINNNIKKQNYKISIHNNKRSINKYISPGSNTNKSKIRHLSDLEINSNNYIKKSGETVGTNKSMNQKLSKNQNKNLSIYKIIKSKSNDKDKIPNKLKFSKENKNYSPFQFKSDHLHKIKNKIKIQNRNQDKNMEHTNKTSSSHYNISENILLNKEHTPNKIDIYNHTDINRNNNQKRKKIKNLKYISIDIDKNKSPMKRKEMIYHKKFVNLNKRKTNSVENEHLKKKYNLEITNLNNANNHNFSLISLYTNQIKNGINMAKIKKKIMSNLSNVNNSLSSLRENKNNITKKKRFFSQERAKKFFQIKPNKNIKAMKDKNVSDKNNNNPINNNMKKDDMKQISKNEGQNQNYINNNTTSIIYCNSSLTRIREVVQRILSNRLYTANNQRGLMINTFYSNSSVILRCKLVNKICNLYFELHISFNKDSQKYVTIKPNLLKGNKLIFMKLFEKIKNELIN